MDLFEIVSSFIPDEQKADIKAKIDGQVDLIVKNNEKVVKKDISKKYGVNFFEEDLEKAFSDSLFVKKEVVENAIQENARIKQELADRAKEVETYKEESLINKVTIQLVKEGFKEERINLVKPLLKDSKENETIEEKVLRVKQEVPELFLGTKDRNPYNGGGGDPKKTGMEEYFEKRREEMSKLNK